MIHITFDSIYSTEYRSTVQMYNKSSNFLREFRGYVTILTILLLGAVESGHYKCEMGYIFEA